MDKITKIYSLTVVEARSPWAELGPSGGSEGGSFLASPSPSDSCVNSSYVDSVWPVAILLSGLDFYQGCIKSQVMIQKPIHWATLVATRILSNLLSNLSHPYWKLFKESPFPQNKSQSSPRLWPPSSLTPAPVFWTPLAHSALATPFLTVAWV